MPKRKDAPQVYEVMSRFRDRCLVNDGSLLWDEPSVWTTKNLERIKKRFIDNPDAGEGSFWQKIAIQFEGLPAECHKILTDSFVVYSLPSTFMRPETKWGFVEAVAAMAHLDVPNPALVREALTQGVCRTSQRYHAKYMQLWLIMLCALRAKQKGLGVLGEPWPTAALLDSCLTEFAERDRSYDMRHAILHMLFPDDFERMISTDHKRRVVATFLGADRPSLKAGQGELVPGQKVKVDLTALDRDVATARQMMMEKHNPENPDFYSPRILGLWKKSRAGPDKPPVEVEDDDDGLPVDGKLQELVNPLKETGQIILYGPPGTGKTYYAMKLAETLIASENLNAEMKNLTQEALDSLKSGVLGRVGAWWVVANPEQWSWQSIRPGEDVDFRYGNVRRHFEEIQLGDWVIGYEAYPTRAIRALGRIASLLEDRSEGRSITIKMSDWLKKPVPYSDVAKHPILQESEPVRMSNRGTLFRLGSSEARALRELIVKSNPGVSAVFQNDLVDGAERGDSAGPDVPYLRLCTFHPSYGYEDFVEGFQPDLTSDGQPYYRVRDGIFKAICNDARQQPDKTFVLIIDEINRGNIPRIFGELITLIEWDKRWKPGTHKQFSPVLPTSGETFAVPQNVYIIGTMNTADKSIALLDTALRRRFAFKELMPDPDVLGNTVIADIPLDELLAELNRRVTEHLGRNLQIGHAYFMDGPEPVRTPHRLAAVLRDKVFPLLQDYCYDDYSALVQILGEGIVDPVSQAFRPEVVATGEDDELLAAIQEIVKGG